MNSIRIEITRSQYDQLADLIIKTRSLLQVHQTGEVKVPTVNNNIRIEWTAQAVELTIPD